MRTLLIFTALISASACAPEPPGLPANLKNMPMGAQALDSQSKASFSKLMELKTQNDALCLRVQKQRVECPVATASLTPDDDQKVLGCVSGVDPNATVESNFELNIVVPSGTKAILTTKNGMWQTQAVGTGTKQKLTWGPRTKSPCDILPPKSTSLVKSPRVIELSDMFLKVVPDSCSNSTNYKKSDVSTFVLFLNGQALFDRNDLSDTNGGIQIALTKILGFQQDAKCAVPRDELKKLMDDALATKPVASSDPQPPDLEQQFARESNRNDQLIKQLTGAENLGCWGYSKIKKLQVKVEGAALANSNRGDSSSALQNAGNSKEYTFTFGQNMFHTVPDESQGAIFRPGGGFTTNAFSDREIQELRGLRIKKGGVAYQNDPFRLDGFFGIGAWSGFHRYELDLRSFSKITILANDQVVYEKAGFSFTFASNSLVWPSNDGAEQIQNNPAFIQLMTRNDCPAE
ncbi:MAG: hypothetical protein ACO3A4_02850 [Silvanigrellaceae bacterium]